MRWWIWVIIISVVLICVVLVILTTTSKKKDEDAGLPPPPSGGAASSDELSTQLGSARGLNETLAPTSVKWTHAYAIDDKRVLIAGDLVNETIALLTDDGGANWRSLKGPRDAWSSWSVGLDGTIVLGAGGREGAPSPSTAMLSAAQLAFATFDATSLTAPTPLFPTLKGPVQGLLQTEGAVPAVLAPSSAALIAEESPRKPFVFYGGKPGSDAVAPLMLPTGEKIVPVPYGRPATLLSIRGRDLIARPFPAPAKPLDKPVKVPGVTMTPTLLGELSTSPACESGGWSFQRIKQAKGVVILGIAQAKTVALAMPDATATATKVGCGAGHLVVEAVAAKSGAPATWASQPDIPTLLACDLAGKCVTPKNSPFRLWPEQHKREIVATATEKGILGVLTARAGDRWGLYLAQGPGDGSVYERQRVIGEGTTDRGRIELGALVSFGQRALLLLSADVTGTSRRGWFVMVSDDGGTNWGPP
jgi:hypothetical protein